MAAGKVQQVRDDSATLATMMSCQARDRWSCSGFADVSKAGGGAGGGRPVNCPLGTADGSHKHAYEFLTLYRAI